MRRSIERLLASPGQTLALGRALGELLVGGDFVALTGPLGAGKTQLVKGLAQGLAIPAEEPVVSPTFVLVREYRGRLTLYHVDAYRLSGSAALLELGLEEMCGDPSGVVALEWADRTPETVPNEACRVALGHVSPTQRRAVVQWADVERLGRLEAAVGAR